MLIRLRAAKAHPSLREGLIYEASPIQAAADTWRRFATFTTDLPAENEDDDGPVHADKVVEIEPQEPIRTKRHYRRRDMQAED